MLDSSGQPRWGLYVSIPFCRFKCTYCNFASGVFPFSRLEQYLEAVRWEIRQWGRHRDGTHMPGGPPTLEQRHATLSPADSRLLADSIYLGGGTPSLLTAGQLGRLLDELRQVFGVTSDTEITLEAAPGSFSREVANGWRACGVNRASLGVQSFTERELKAVGRPHRAETVLADVATLRGAGITNVSFDLIAGLPYQTTDSWEASLEWVEHLRPEHVSVYMLEIDADSRLGAEVLAGGASYSACALPDEDAVADFYCRATEQLAELGYCQYEISNFALAGRDSRHNRKYWEGAPYLGFGLDAHSYDGAQRWANTASLEEYLARVGRQELPVAERHPSDERRCAEERMFLGLRLNEGVELSSADHYRYRREINELTQASLLEFDAGRLRLTPRGRLLSNEVFTAFIN